MDFTANSIYRYHFMHFWRDIYPAITLFSIAHDYLCTSLTLNIQMKQASNEFKISVTAALQQLTESKQEFIQLFGKGSLQIELYKPKEVDKQQPHTRDEIYVIVSGKAMFYKEGFTVAVAANDCLHVPAFAEHRFFNFSEDFVTWVIFYGPEGGEK
jgi:mannose-6-phosphate isomerase-like protein (cupin superfamily)